MSINIQKALGFAQKFLSNDKINQAIEMSKSIDSPQSAFNALSKIGNPNQIIDNGLSKLNSPMANKVAVMMGANEEQMELLKNQILSIKGQSPKSSSLPDLLNSNNNKNNNTNGVNMNSKRIQDLINGLK